MQYRANRSRNPISISYNSYCFWELLSGVALLITIKCMKTMTYGFVR